MWRKPPSLVPGCINSYTPVTLAGFQTRGPSAQTAGLFICFLLSLGGWDLLPNSIIAFSRVSIIDTGLPVPAWCNNDDARGDCVVMTETWTEVILKFCYCPGCGFLLLSKIITCSSLGRLKRGTLNSVLFLWFQGISFAIAVVSPRGAQPGDLSADHRALFHCLRRVLVSTEICTFPVHIYHPELRGELEGGGGCRILGVFLPPRSPFVLVVKGQGEKPLTDYRYLLINDTPVLWGHFRWVLMAKLFKFIRSVDA